MNYEQASEALASEVAEDFLLLTPDLNYYCLNETARTIWDLIEQPISPTSLRELLSRRYLEQPTGAEAELQDFLDWMVDVGVANKTDDVASGLQRDEALDSGDDGVEPTWERPTASYLGEVQAAAAGGASPSPSDGPTSYAVESS